MTKVTLNFTSNLACFLNITHVIKLYYKILFDVSNKQHIIVMTTKKTLNSNIVGKKYRADKKTINGFGVTINEEDLNLIGWEDENTFDLNFIEKKLLKDNHIEWIFSFQLVPAIRVLSSPHGEMTVSAPRVSMRYIELELNRLSMLYNSTAWEIYKRKVQRITRQSWANYEDIINPNNLIRNRFYHLDHQFSMNQGFLDGVLPELIGHPMNLIVISRGQNCSKNKNCSISLSTLRQRCKKFDNSQLNMVI